MVQEFDFNMMKISEIIKRVTQICRSLHVVRLDLFGSFATGTATMVVTILLSFVCGRG